MTDYTVPPDHQADIEMYLTRIIDRDGPQSRQSLLTWTGGIWPATMVDAAIDAAVANGPLRVIDDGRFDRRVAQQTRANHDQR